MIEVEIFGRGSRIGLGCGEQCPSGCPGLYSGARIHVHVELCFSDVCMNWSLKESGETNVSKATARLSKMKTKKNANRDLTRFVKLPLEPRFKFQPI